MVMGWPRFFETAMEAVSTLARIIVTGQAHAALRPAAGVLAHPVATR